MRAAIYNMIDPDSHISYLHHIYPYLVYSMFYIIFTYEYVYIYIDIDRERERERKPYAQFFSRTYRICSTFGQCLFSTDQRPLLVPNVLERLVSIGPTDWHNHLSRDANFIRNLEG